MFRPIFAAAFAAVLALPAAAQTPPTQIWPTRPVTMVVPFAAGGPMDVVGRIMATSLGEQLGQQVIVENVGGGGGMTGAARVAKAPPDGSQFVLGNVGTHAVSQSLSKNPPYNVAADFAPVALIADLSLVLITRKDLPAADLQEFIAYAKANEDKMQFGSASTGSATHLGCALLNAAIGVNVTLIEGGQIKALAILTRGRSASLPNLPSAQEQGLANFEAANWAAFFMPKGTPAPIVEKLAAASAAATGSATVQKRMKEIGVDPVAPDRRSPEYLATFVEAEIAKWAGPVKASGLATD
jgi:tripartite-type tricarboxylate transporter receptor subunit TctC